MRYRVLPDGTLADPKLLYDATVRSASRRTRRHESRCGGKYLQRRSRRRLDSFAGRQALATILIPERVANVAWGGPDRKTLYICASSSVYRVQLSIAGEPIVQTK